MKTLYLVRHAKSSWSDPSLSDQQRPLNKRGLKNAPYMGKHLRRRAVNTDLIISSPALRAFTTASLLAAEIDYPQSDIEKNNRLYFDGITAMLNIVQQCSPEISSVMLVAHNPDITSFLNSLCGYQVDSMPTCAIASIAFESEWSDIEFKKGHLIDYDYPKKTMSDHLL